MGENVSKCNSQWEGESVSKSNGGEESGADKGFAPCIRRQLPPIRHPLFWYDDVESLFCALFPFVNNKFESLRWNISFMEWVDLSRLKVIHAMWMPGRVSRGVVEQVKWGAGTFERKGTSTVVHTRSVRNTTSGKVATMNARANSRHLQNSWKSCMWALFCHLGGLSGRLWARKYPKFSFNVEEFQTLNVLTAGFGPPKYWRLIWKFCEISDLQL